MGIHKNHSADVWTNELRRTRHNSTVLPSHAMKAIAELTGTSVK